MGMTKEEAVSLLMNISAYDIDNKRGMQKREALNMAIQALEQQPSEDWYDVPSDEMTLEQARQAVKNLRKKLAEHLEQQPNRCDSCVHSEEQDGSNCYECVKGMTDNFETQPTDADCISREATKEMLIEEWTKHIPMELDINLSFVLEKISELPSVTPKSEYSWKEIKIKFECDDCISRQAVLDLTGKFDWFESSDDYNDFICAVCNLPSVKPTRPKGVWLKRDYWSEGVGMGETYGYYYQCSECKKMVKGGYISCDDKFCSNCGAEMRGSEE